MEIKNNIAFHSNSKTQLYSQNPYYNLSFKAEALQEDSVEISSKNEGKEGSKAKAEENSKKTSKQNAKTAAIPAGTFLAGALLAGIALTPKISRLRNMSDITGQKTKEAVEAALRPYRDELASSKAKINAIIDAKTSGEIDEKLLEVTRKEITDYKLDYDPQNPLKYIKEDKDHDYILLDGYKPTSNRAKMTALNIPEFRPGSRWSFEMPDSPAIKLSNEKRIDFQPIENCQTNIALDYADSVQWSDDKIARDILQNFYDGHGQTLDGVKIAVDNIPGGKYKVRIEGKGIYTPDKAIFLGETSKRNNAEAAGNYGEGLKMTALKILKDSGAKEVITGSDNWKLTYKASESDVANKKVLAYSLDKVEPYSGNYFEFETDKLSLVLSLKKTLKRFYHSANEDFKCPDFENSQFGIKYLPEGKKGGVYIAGQKFEFNGDFEGVKNANIFLKSKPPTKAKLSSYRDEEVVFDPSRDRIGLNSEDLNRLGKYFGFNEKTSKQELAYAIKSLEQIWPKTEDIINVDGGRAFLTGLVDAAYSRNIYIKFPEKYLALPRGGSVNSDILKDLKNSGFEICPSDFGYIGMTNVNDYVLKARNHGAFAPTEKEIKKIGIIRKAVQQLRPYIENEKFFSSTELNPEIYLFNAKGNNESKTYKNTLAEAILVSDYTSDFMKKSIGFWIDRDYLSKASFPEILSTALHEITHKSGGDGSSEFTYKLTDVLEKEIASRLEDKQANIELKNLRKLWDELSTN